MDFALGSLTEKPHHDAPGQYADSWEDCLVMGEGFTEDATSAKYYGAPEGSTLVALCDATDGPVTRAKFYCDDPETVAALKNAYPEGMAYRFRANEAGSFQVVRHEPTQNDVNTCILFADYTDPDVVASVEKFVPIALKDSHFPIGRRFSLEAA